MTVIACQLCGKMLPQKHLKFHMAIEHGQNILVESYNCPNTDCDRSFSYKNSLTKHLKSCRKVTTETTPFSLVNNMNMDVESSNNSAELYFHDSSKE